MNISKWIYLFISLFVSTISCTHIQPKEKILIKIVYNNKIEEKFLEAVKAGFTEKYNAANKSNSYKTFDEVFKIKMNLIVRKKMRQKILFVFLAMRLQD